MESRFEKRVLYIQDNANHYLNKFSILETSGSRISWNWCAFLFTSAWMIYRKMYKPAIIVMAIEYLAIPLLAAVFSNSIPIGPLPLTTGVGSALSWAISILLGLFGNYIYMKYIDELMDNEPADDAFSYQQKYGGISWKLVIIFIIIGNVINLFMEKLFM